jgi:hypothetical protein
MDGIREYLVRFQNPTDEEGDVEVELTAETGEQAIQIARSLPRFSEERWWRVTAVDVTPQDPSCNVLNIYRDGGETPDDPHYSPAPAGSTCPR